jgi:putative phosphoesterase
MKIAVFSDSHGRTDGMVKAVYDCSPDLIVHLGDYFKDAEELKKEFPQTALRAVRGNCDFLSSTPEAITINVGDAKIFITHGHRYGVKSGLGPLIREALSLNANIVIFGHTHISYYEASSGIHVLNPGTAGGSRQAPSYALVEIDKAGISCVILPL